jgi:NAD(P)H-hydrate epimerase
MKKYFEKIYIPKKGSHKGQNGRLLIIGGSKLFHSASMWSLEVASRIVDLVHYSSVEENNRIIENLKEEFRNGIVVRRDDIEYYVEEDDCILIGPGMVRADISNINNKISSIKDIVKIDNEGLQTYYLTKYLLQKYPQKRWVIDAGALQMLDVKDIPKNAILTPHKREFEYLWRKFKIQNSKFKIISQNSKIINRVKDFADETNSILLLKGEEDIISNGEKVESIKGGNVGMTKGGTGDVLAGLIAAFYCKTDAFTSAIAASYINKKAGEDLEKEKGIWFNASDLAEQIPKTMKRLLEL